MKSMTYCDRQSRTFTSSSSSGSSLPWRCRHRLPQQSGHLATRSTKEPSSWHNQPTRRAFHQTAAHTAESAVRPRRQLAATLLGWILVCSCSRMHKVAGSVRDPRPKGLARQVALKLGFWMDASICRISASRCAPRISSFSAPSGSTCRGGGTAAVTAGAATKTMTARQMETFNLMSGGIAGTVASCITNPLEVIKTQLQSSSTSKVGSLAKERGHPMAVARTILEKDGVAGFFRGLPPTLIGIIPSRSAYFYAYNTIKRALGPYLREGSPPNAMVAGLMAGIVGNSLTNPIWMVRTRMQLLADPVAGQRAYTGYGDAIRTIWREEGAGGFYRGIRASYWGCLEGSVQFILYEQFKRRLLEGHNRLRLARNLPPTSELTNAEYFWSAAAAKMVASILTYPHEVARTRMREQARAGIFKYRGMWHTLALISKEEGRQGLYSGLGVHLMKVVPNSALMFLTYEIVRTWLGGFTIVDENGNLM